MKTKADRDPRCWRAAQRIAAIESEYGLAWLRLVLIGIYLLMHYAIYATLSQPTASETRFHERLPLLCGAWCVVSLAVITAYHWKWLPVITSFFVVLADIANLTVIASQSGGPTGVAVTCYFVILATSSLRCNEWLVAVATGFAMFAFLALVGMTDQIWFDQYHAVPVNVTVITALSLLSCGVLAAWMIRVARRVAYACQELQVR